VFYLGEEDQQMLCVSHFMERKGMVKTSALSKNQKSKTNRMTKPNSKQTKPNIL
jgi:hypothetical protein